jgi:hypothetical protein
MLTFSQLVTQQNAVLFQELSAQVRIELAPSDDEYWGEITENGKATIYYASDPSPVAAFTHELLHIKYRLLGYQPRVVIKYEVERENDAHFLDLLTDYAPNQLMHHKIFPEFTAMGFQPGEFLAAGDLANCERVFEEDIPLLKRTYKRTGKKLDARAIIFPYLFLKSPHSNSQRSQMALRVLRNISDRFYDLEKLINGWCQEDHPDYRLCFARLFCLCGFPNVWLALSENDVVRARDCASF